MKKTLIFTSISLVAIVSIYGLFFQYLDQSIAFAIKQHEYSWLYSASLILGKYTSTKILFIVSIIITAFTLILHCLKGKQAWIMQVYFYISSLIFVMIVGKIVKYSLARYRPIMLFDHNTYGFHFMSSEWAMNSTPSGHALCGFSIALAASLLCRRYSLLFYGIALIICISRVLCNEHFASDIILGAHIGTIVTYINYHYWKRFKLLSC